jgi:hypothetical protein
MATNPSVPPRPQQPSQQAQPSQEVAPLSEGQRLINTFFAPSKTFTDVRRNASWWAPFLIIAIVSSAFIYVVDQKVGFRKVLDNLIQLQPKSADQLDRMPADQRQTVMRQQVTYTRFISYAFPVIALAVYAVFAGLLYATLKFGAIADVKYKTVFALIVYARLPLTLGPLLAIVSLLAGVNIDAFNLRNPAATNPGYFIGLDGSPVLRALLTQIDVFSFWTMTLTAIGITCIGKVKRNTAFAVVFGWFAVYVVGLVLVTAATS